MYVCIYVCMYVCMHVCMYVGIMYVCVCVCMYAQYRHKVMGTPRKTGHCIISEII